MTNSTPNNSLSSEQLKAKERASLLACGIQKAELHSPLSAETEYIRDCSLREKCSGVMGVPITFLDKYSPDQFEILGMANSARYLGDFPCYTIIKGRKLYNRILIKRRNVNED